MDVYALVHMVCTNVDFMQLARYCSGYVTLGIKGDDYLLASQSTLENSMFLNFTRNLQFLSLVHVSE